VIRRQFAGKELTVAYRRKDIDGSPHCWGERQQSTISVGRGSESCPHFEIDEHHDLSLLSAQGLLEITL
jgi:hypothetical protein